MVIKCTNYFQVGNLKMSIKWCQGCLQIKVSFNQCIFIIVEKCSYHLEVTNT